MNKPVEHNLVPDHLQERLTRYALDLDYGNISDAAIHAAKVRIIDTMGALVGGFFDEPSQLARSMAGDLPFPTGVSVIGTRMKTTVEMAAFANSIASRSVEINDIAHKPGGRNGHPSDVIAPLLSVAELMHTSGRDYIAGIVLAYEVYLRLAESIISPSFDLANFGCLGTAATAGKLMKLTHEQLAQCISIAATANNGLTQTRIAPLSMWKAVASGEAARAGVFAALMARKGIEGPNRPFEGKHGWCTHIAARQIALETMGGGDVPYRIQDTIIKPRASCFLTLPHILAAEKASGAIKGGIKNIKHVVVETYEQSRAHCGVGEAWWNPDTRDTADHSIPYTVAAALIDGWVDQHSFDDDKLWNPELRALLAKVEVVEDKEFTRVYGQMPVEYRTRVVVTTVDGERIVGESGGEHGGLAEPWSDEQISDKFRGLTEDMLGTKRVNEILERLWNLDDMKDVADIPPAFTFI